MTKQLYLDLDLESVLSIPEHCPGCDARGLEALFDGEQKNLRCPSSEGSRHVELDGVSSIEPPTYIPAVVRPAWASAAGESP